METRNNVEALFFTDKQQVYKVRLNELEDGKVAQMGIYLPGRLGMDEGEDILAMVITGDYSGYVLFFFAGGKCAKIPLASYATKQNRRKLLKAYSDKEPLAKLLFLPEDVVWFGVLTLLGSSMLLTAALDPLLRRVPPAVGVAVSALLFWVTYPTMNGFWNLPGGRLALPQALYASYTTAYLGFMPKSFFSTDYFPLLPWLFLFWAGYFLHHLVGRGRLAPLRRSVCPPLRSMGRHSLVLYLINQPVILGVLTVAFRLMRGG